MNKGNTVKNMGTHVILVTISTLGGKKGWWEACKVGNKTTLQEVYLGLLLSREPFRLDLEQKCGQ